MGNVPSLGGERGNHIMMIGDRLQPTTLLPEGLAMACKVGTFIWGWALSWETIIIYYIWSTFYLQSASELVFISYSAFLNLNKAQVLGVWREANPKIHSFITLDRSTPILPGRSKENSKNKKHKAIQHSLNGATGRWASCLELQQLWTSEFMLQSNLRGPSWSPLWL